MWRWLTIGDGGSAVVGRHASVISGDQKDKGREGEGPVNGGGEDEVLERDGGATKRPGHMLCTMAAHESL
jgi:hypothetical protein